MFGTRNEVAPFDVGVIYCVVQFLPLLYLIIVPSRGWKSLNAWEQL